MNSVNSVNPMKTIAVAILALLFLHCGDDEPAKVSDAMPDCSLDSRAQPYAPGMAATASDGVRVIVVEALPAPPERFVNTWSLQVQGPNGQPVTDASLSVTAFMPDHGHGSPSPPVIEPGEELGDFTMGPFDLWMPGIWELRFVAVSGDTTSLAVLSICVQE